MEHLAAEKPDQECNDKDDDWHKQPDFNEAFYERFIDLLVNQYFHGVIYATQKDKMKISREDK